MRNLPFPPASHRLAPGGLAVQFDPLGQLAHHSPRSWFRREYATKELPFIILCPRGVYDDGTFCQACECADPDLDTVAIGDISYRLCRPCAARYTAPLGIFGAREERMMALQRGTDE